MTSIATRSSVLALVPETTEGTPVAPAAATQYTAMQGDLAIKPVFAVQENDEKRSSIGRGKVILGAEAPTVSFSHYIRHSGTEGAAPDYNDLLKALFGTETVNSTQRATTSGSGTSTIILAAGGSDFARGAGILLKDTTNGSRIRAVHSVSSNTLTLGFQVPVAPATGMNVGKCVYYSPASTGHQTLTLWHYMGNGGTTEMVSGCRVTEMALDASAGELINANFSLEGIGYYQNPITATSSKRYIDWENDDGTFAAAVAVKVYKSPHELAAAIQTAMNTASTGETHTVTYSNTTGKFTFTSTGTLLSLLFLSGTNNANSIATLIGFAAADATGTAAATGYTSATAQSFASPYTPTLDSANALAAKYQEVMLGEVDDYVCFEASKVSVTVSNERAEIKSICAETGVSGSTITGREVKISLTALLNKYDTDAWERFRTNAETRFQFSFGEKTGSNWTPGKCGYIYAPTTTVTDFQITESDDLAVLEMELTCFVDESGNGECYLGFL